MRWIHDYDPPEEDNDMPLGMANSGGDHISTRDSEPSVPLTPEQHKVIRQALAEDKVAPHIRPVEGPEVEDFRPEELVHTHPTPGEDLSGTTKVTPPKPNYLYSPPWCVTARARVYTFGAEKHAPFGWLQPDHSVEELLDKSLRHIYSMLGGELYDPETGEFHAIHATCDLEMALDRLVKLEGKPEREER